MKNRFLRFCTYAGGLALGAPVEIVNVAATQGIKNVNISITQPINPCSIPGRDMRKHARAERAFGGV